jgi:hypothetical protein
MTRRATFVRAFSRYGINDFINSQGSPSHFMVLTGGTRHAPLISRDHRKIHDRSRVSAGVVFRYINPQGGDMSLRGRLI